jgi:uncharacterized tannase-like protein DUF6351
MTSLRYLVHGLGALTCCAAGWSCGSGSNALGPGPAVQIKTLSNRADLISGGDALVEIVYPPDATTQTLHVAVAGRDVSSAFDRRANNRVIGLITGMTEGPNLVTADLGGERGAQLTITNHNIGGPVVSGAQIMPFVCATPASQAPTASAPGTNFSGLTTNAIDQHCNIATEIRLYYKSTSAGCTFDVPDPEFNPPANPCFRPYNPASPPGDLAMTTTDTGLTVPYIVRDERGTVNRGIYDIVVLFDPTKDDPRTGWKPTAPQAAWNGKVVYSFGPSSGQPRLQFRSEQPWTDDAALSRGFLVAINSMTDSAYNSNRVVMAETVMMMKERIADGYGEIRYTIGNGCSGGSINQLNAASIYAGLLDGILPTCTFSDAETTAIEVADCELLVRFYVSQPWQDLVSGLATDVMNGKKAAINGHLDQSACHAWFNSFARAGKPGNFHPENARFDTGAITTVGTATTNNCGLPASLVYDAVTNPSGARCSPADYAVAIWGQVPGANRARTTFDNVGVQYGLQAFLASKITAEEFVTLNEKIGGLDGDDQPSAVRSHGDPEALRIAYAAGIVSDGHQLAKTPIIDLRGWDDSILVRPAIGIHHVWRSFALRQRLDDAVGNHNNHVMWQFGTSLVAPPASGLTLQSFLMMDQWVAALKADTSSAPMAVKVAASKPAGAYDFCYLTGDTTFTTKVTDLSMCRTDSFLAPHASPRQVAGGPVAENILKCQLKSIDRNDYPPGSFSDMQFDRLSLAFPEGVCDFSKPGVGQAPATSPLDFSAGPGGQPFPPAPTSSALMESAVPAPPPPQPGY